MSIQYNPNAPQDTHNKLSRWLPTFQQSAAEIGATKHVEFNISHGYQVNYPSLQQLQSGQLLCATRNNRWRHLVFAGNHVIGEIELDADFQPVTFYQGQAKDGLLAALNQAEQVLDDFAFSLIVIPGLKFTALWLQTKDQDLIMPFEPNQTEHENLQTHEPGEVAKSLLKTLLENGLTEDLGG